MVQKNVLGVGEFEQVLDLILVDRGAPALYPNPMNGIRLFCLFAPEF
jgi:hypothetical protein